MAGVARGGGAEFVRQVGSRVPLCSLLKFEIIRARWGQSRLQHYTSQREQRQVLSTWHTLGVVRVSR